MKVLNPRGAKTVEEVESGMIKRNPRIRYSGMKARMEMAAQVLAVGGTQRLAAKYAGCSERQIKKYYTDPDFRVRIEELRTVLASKVKGRIFRELSRRTTSDKIKQMELLDMLRILDRITVGGKGMAINVSGDVNVGDTNYYEAILASLFNPNSGPDGGDFPVYEPDRIRLSSGSPPVE